MTDTLGKKASDTLQEEGLLRFIQKSLHFTYRKCASYLFSATTGDLERLSVGRVQVQSSESVNIKYEGRFESELPPNLARLQKKIVAPRRIIREYEDVALFGKPTFVTVGWKHFYPTSVGNTKSNFSPSQHTLQSITPPKPNSNKEVKCGFFIGGDRSGFAQWFYEQLPKLYWYEKYCSKTNNRPNLIISGELPEWKKRSLELLGYPFEKVIHHQKSDVFRIDRLVLPPHPIRTHGGEFQICPSAIQWIKERTLSNISQDSSNFSKRVYISRADAERRKVINESEVISHLKQYGFESYEPGRLSFDDQVQLFANADIIVGPHGAGLTNMIHSDETNVLELMTKESGEHFFVLANECNHQYELLSCNSIVDKQTKPRYRDMEVNLSQLELQIKSILF